MYTPITHCPAVAGMVINKEYQCRWVLVDNHQQILPATTPRLADIQVTIKMGYLVIKAPGMLRLDIPMEVIEDDESVFEKVYGESSIEADGSDNKQYQCNAIMPDELNAITSNKQHLSAIRVVSEGDLAAQWFSVYLQQPVRLMKKV